MAGGARRVSIWQRALSWLSGPMTATDARLYEALGGTETHTAESVSVTSVMGLSTAWACVNLLAGTMASLSLDMNRKDERQVRIPSPEHPLQRVLNDPNADQTGIDFWEQMHLALELWGNAYARIDRNGGVITALTPVRPEVMQVERMRSGALRYTWYDDGRNQVGEDDILHIRGNGGDPMGGMSTIAWNRNTFGSAQAIERAAGKTFANGIRSSGAFVAERDLTPEQMAQASERIDQKYVGAMNAGRPMFLNNGLKYVPISFKPEEAQMLESRGFSVEEICRVFGVPPFAVGHTEKVTSFGSGLEQQLLWFQKTALRKRAKKVEQSIRKQLLSPEDRRAGYGVSHNFEDFLRTDTKARAEFYKIMTDIKAYTINDVLAIEGRAPKPWGDEPWVQMQDEQLSERERDNEQA